MNARLSSRHPQSGRVRRMHTEAFDREAMFPAMTPYVICAGSQAGSTPSMDAGSQTHMSLGMPYLRMSVTRLVQARGTVGTICRLRHVCQEDQETLERFRTAASHIDKAGQRRREHQGQNQDNIEESCSTERLPKSSISTPNPKMPQRKDCKRDLAFQTQTHRNQN